MRFLEGKGEVFGGGPEGGRCCSAITTNAAADAADGDAATDGYAADSLLVKFLG